MLRLPFAKQRHAMSWSHKWTSTPVTYAAAYSDGRVATCSNDLFIRIFSGAEISLLEGHVGTPCCVAWSRDGYYLVSGGMDNFVILWETETGFPIKILKLHQKPVLAVAFNNRGNIFASASADGTARIWTLAKLKMRAFFNAHDAPVTSVDFSYEGTLCVTGSQDGTVRLWDVARRRLLRTVEGCPSKLPLTYANLLPNARYVISGSSNGVFYIKDYHSQQNLQIYELPKHDAKLREAAFVDNRLLVAGPHGISAFDVYQANLIEIISIENGITCIQNLNKNSNFEISLWPKLTPIPDDRKNTLFVAGPDGFGFIDLYPCKKLADCVAELFGSHRSNTVGMINDDEEPEWK